MIWVVRGIGSLLLLPLELEASEIDPSRTMSISASEFALLCSARGWNLLGCCRSLILFGSIKTLYARLSGDVAPPLVPPGPVRLGATCCFPVRCA